MQRHFYVCINNCMIVDGSLYYKLGATQYTMMFKANNILNDSKKMLKLNAYKLNSDWLHLDFINSICMDAAQLARAALLAIEQ